MPVDLCSFVTYIRVDPRFYTNPANYHRDREFPILKIKRGLPNNNADERLTFHVINYQGASGTLEKKRGMPLSKLTMTVNPSKILLAHNGHILTEDEFLDSLGILMRGLEGLLEEPLNPLQWKDLIAGLRCGGPAFWKYLEIPFQCLDFEGRKFSLLRHLRHPAFRLPARIWPGESIELGSKKSSLQLSIYFKEKEMLNHGSLSKGGAFQNVLRLEARLRGPKLVDYLKSERNVEMQPADRKEGQFSEVKPANPRLVRFTRRDLIAAHRKIFGELDGIWSSMESGPDCSFSNKQPQPESLGRLLATVSLDDRVSETFPQLYAAMRCYHGDSWDKGGRIRKAGCGELSRRSTLTPAVFFSDEAWSCQPGVENEEKERSVRHADESNWPEIREAYAPNMEFFPRSHYPRYFDHG